MIKVTLKQLLKNRKMTLTEVSRETGISLKALSAFQNQRTDGVQYNTLDKLSKVLNVEVGEILKRIDHVLKLDVNIHKSIEFQKNTKVNVDATLTITDVNDQLYNSLINFDIYIHEYDTFKDMFIYIKSLDRSELSVELNDVITNELQETHHQFLLIVSHMIVQRLLQEEALSNFNIYDNVRVSWRRIANKYRIDNVNYDAISNENERIMFVEEQHHINLVPLNPDMALEENSEKNLAIPYTANMDDLASLSMLYNIELNEDYERLVYITLD